MEIVASIHPIINPNGVPADPIDRYLAKEERKDCERCWTSIKVFVRTEGDQGKTCRIDTKRCLVSWPESEDSGWRARCHGDAGRDDQAIRNLIDGAF